MCLIHGHGHPKHGIRVRDPRSRRGNAGVGTWWLDPRVPSHSAPSEASAGRSDGVECSRHSYEIIPCEEEGGHHLGSSVCLASVNFIWRCVSDR